MRLELTLILIDFLNDFYSSYCRLWLCCESTDSSIFGEKNGFVDFAYGLMKDLSFLLIGASLRLDCISIVVYFGDPGFVYDLSQNEALFFAVLAGM